MRNFFVTVIIILFLLTASILGSVYINKNNILESAKEWIFGNETSLKSISPKTSFEKPKFFDYFADPKSGIYAAKFDLSSSSLKYISQENLKNSTSDFLSNSKEATLVVNAGYFSPEYDHIGLLRIDSQVISQLSFNNPQVNTVLEVNNNPITFRTTTPAEDLILDTSSFELAFQTGPIILKDDVLQDSSIINSLNGNGDFLRSVIGYSTDGYGFILSSINSTSLKELSNYILEEEFFTGNITAVNLDGGSSVSFASSENEEFGFGRSKALPYYIVIESKN